MDEPLGLLYKAIVDTVRATGINIKWIDIDLGQIDKDAEIIPIEFPALLLKFEDVIWRDKSPDLQEGLVNVSVKLVYKFQSESDNYTAIKVRNEAVDFLQLLYDLNNILIAIRGESFSKLVRYNQYLLKTKPEYFHWIQVMEYQCNIQSDCRIENPEVVNIYYDEIQNSNIYMERRKFNLIHK